MGAFGRPFLFGVKTVSPLDFTKAAMQAFEFNLTGPFIELHSLLKLTGVCDSGGAGKMRVAAGKVMVDGKVELRKTCKIQAGQIVSLDDVRIQVIAAPGAAE
jgi:ribosome-associated protein